MYHRTSRFICDVMAKIFSRIPLSGYSHEHVPMNGLNKTESAVFLLCQFSLILKDLFSRLFRYVN